MPKQTRSRRRPGPSRLEQQIIEHGRAAFREDAEETCCSDNLLELYFDLKSDLPLEALQRYITLLSKDLS